MERLTERQENGFVVFKNRPRGALCGERFCSISDRCKNIEDRTCPYLKMINRLAAYEDTGLEPENIISAVDMARIACALHELNAYTGLGTIDHLRDLVQAEQDGRLVVLPCKVGDTVYLTYGDCVIEAEVTCIRPFVFKDKTEFRGNAAWRYEDPFYNDGRILEQDMFIVFGKNAFLTREEAEAALKGGAE